MAKLKVRFEEYQAKELARESGLDALIVLNEDRTINAVLTASAGFIVRVVQNDSNQDSTTDFCQQYKAPYNQ